MTSKGWSTPLCRLFLSILLGALLFECCDASAQDTDVLKSRALTAVRRAALSGPMVKPFHLIADLTIYDGAGKNPQSGSLDVVRDEHRSKGSLTFSDSTAVVLNTPGGNYSSSAGKLPYYAPLIARVLQSPFAYKGFGVAPAVLPKDLPVEMPVDCIAVLPGTEAVVRGPEVPIHEICLDTKSDDLAVIVDDKMEFVRENLFTFDEQRLAKKLQLRVGGILVGEAEIKQLANASPDENEFVPTADMKPEVKPVANIPGSVMAGKILKHESPKYPGVAKIAHIQGVVLLHAIIGKDGHISSLSIISSPDKTLSEASIKAVKQWVYEPYLLNGQPTEVDTTITVSFALGKP